MPKLSEVRASYSNEGQDTPTEATPETKKQPVKLSTVSSSYEKDPGIEPGLLSGGILGEVLQTAGSFIGMAGKTSLPGMALSGVGGAGGEAYKQIGQHITGSELAPKSAEEAAGRIGRAFLEEAAFEGVGRAGAKIFSKIGDSLMPNLKSGFDDFEKTFEKYGGRLSATQRIEHKNLASWSLLTLDGLSRGSITAKGIYQNFDKMNDTALRKWSDALIDDISEESIKNLSDHQVGRLFIDSIENGKAVHHAVAGRFYGAVDNIAKSNGLTVSVDPIKNTALEWQKKYAKIADVGKSKAAKTELDKVVKLTDSIGFEDAHFLRSALMSKKAEMDAAGETGVAMKIMGDLISSVEKAMDTSGSNAAIKDAYSKATKYYKLGASSFNSKFIVDLVRKSPERVGETIFRSGNVDQVYKARHAIKRASLIDKSLDYQKTWSKVQEGYMSSLLSGQIVDEAGTPVGKRILKMFENKKQLRTLKAAFTEGQLTNLKKFATVAETVQAPPEAGLSMVMSLTQAGVVLGVIGGVIQEGAGTLFLGPPIVAKMLTNPKTAAKFTKLLTIPLNDPKAATAFTKFVGDLSTKERQEFDELYAQQQANSEEQ